MSFNYNHLRAKKSRLMNILRLFLPLLNLLKIVGVISGFSLIFMDSDLGWIVLAIVSVVTIMIHWWNGELHRLAPSTELTIEGQMASNILGKLSKNPTSEQIAKVVLESSGGKFIAARFGLGKTTIESLVQIPQNSPENIFQTALQIQQKLKTKTVSGSVLALAIVRNFPNYETLLAQFYVDFEDLERGVLWHDHIFSLINKSKIPMKTGGIARDWSFGYTPTLNRFGVNITNQVSNNILMSSNLEQHKELVSKMIEQFSGQGKQNIALIGVDGVGKTTVVNSFAAKIANGNEKIPSNLKFRQVISLDASSLIAAAPGRGEIENLLNYVLNEAYAAKNIIICLDNAQLFFEDGVGSVDVSNLLLPIIQGGVLRMILTMDEQRFLQISAKNPALAQAMNRLQVNPANYDETLAVMQDKLLLFEHQNGVLYQFQALKEAYRLSQRYIFDLEMPGRAVRLLEMSAGFAENKIVTASSVEKAIEQTMNVKISTANVDEEKETLLNLENLLHARMVGQEKAVSVVANALRRARTGVRNQNRPIGTFLFLGPTGVGKTELSKALSEVYFNGEDNIIRLDLNEYVNLEDVPRLIADGSRDASSLTAQMMKKPFSVVLLDEIEKAHPNVLTALLQVLDEGILRDEKNREVSFRDAIIIATSNAGAERIQELIARGYDSTSAEEVIVNDLIASREFRPEFLNRFDEIVVFEPLTKENLLQIIDLMITGVNKTLAGQKISVSVTPEARLMLAEMGYDPKLGARPMRRVIQRVVENTIARKMLSGEAQPGSNIEITPDIVQQS
ncbi:MAG: ATP-dependent Clp protease ATP-binding subunit [Candidatus Nanogingivalaceae bacterium]|mgnify:FL=1|nr:ATP-dependent Clp protease ATP-binding subunit [Candidatus Nanogingivalaceae bacterium]